MPVVRGFLVMANYRLFFLLLRVRSQCVNTATIQQHTTHASNVVFSLNNDHALTFSKYLFELVTLYQYWCHESSCVAILYLRRA